MSHPYTDNVFNKDVKNPQQEAYLQYLKNTSVSSFENEKSDSLREPSKPPQFSGW